ncbi:hypothetical protein ACWX0K_20550 [Nitrobacteraceae bacterium UC4446_H13]
MTAPKEALEAILGPYRIGDITFDQAAVAIEHWSASYTASLEGDAVERVARIIDPTFDVGIDESPARKTALRKARAILATGLVPDKAAVRADWHTTGWDRARNSGRILLVWREFAGAREHVELGRYSDSTTAWVNTYGHPFHAEPDGWAPLLPFKAAESIRADEREKCAKNDLLLTMERECWSLRCVDIPTGGGDADVGWEVVGHHMAKPFERVVAFGRTPREAIATAIRSGGAQ